MEWRVGDQVLEPAPMLRNCFCEALSLHENLGCNPNLCPSQRTDRMKAKLKDEKTPGKPRA